MLRKWLKKRRLPLGALSAHPHEAVVNKTVIFLNLAERYSASNRAKSACVSCNCVMRTAVSA